MKIKSMAGKAIRKLRTVIGINPVTDAPETFRYDPNVYPKGVKLHNTKGFRRTSPSRMNGGFPWWMQQIPKTQRQEEADDKRANRGLPRLNKVGL